MTTDTSTVLRPRARARTRPIYLFKYVYLGTLALLTVGPLFITWVTAFKKSEQAVFDPFGLPRPFFLDNLRQAWVGARFSTYFGNSVFISLVSVVGVAIVASLAGYALARMRFFGKRLVLFVFLAGLTIPFTAIIIPLYLTMRDLKLLDTHWSVIVAHVAIGTPIFTFIMRAFFQGLPRELEDAARVDGCSELQVFWRVMLPLAKPGLLTVVLLEFLWSWNALLLPLIFLTTESLRTLPIGLLLFQGRTSVEWGLMCAGVLIMSFPVVVLFLIFQKDFVRGLTSGGVKG